MKTLTIRVTKKNIEEGMLADIQTCPIALACNAKKRGWKIRDIFITKFEFFGKNVATLPKKAQEFISRFDRGLEVKPFSFKIKY